MKISARFTNFKRWFELIWHSMAPSLPALPESALWAGYVFLRKYTAQFHFSGDSCGRNMVSSLRLALIEKIPAYPDAAPRGYIHGFLEPISHKWPHWNSWCNPKTYAIRFRMCQVVFWPNLMVTDQYLVLVWADLHVFVTNLTVILGTNNFCSDM